MVIRVEGESCASVNRATVASKQPLAMVRGKMDFYQHRYYRTTKMLMLSGFQWPYLTSRVRCAFFALGLVFTSGQVVIMIMSFVKYRNDWDTLLDFISVSLIVFFCVTKHVNSMYNSDKILKLLNRIRTDWMLWAGEREVNVLHEYAEQCRKHMNIYIVGCYSFILFYLTQPVVPKLIDVVLHNGSEPGQYLIPIYIYHLDDQKYYFYITLYFSITGYLCLTIAASYDVMLFLSLQHCCGIFTALGHKLENLGADEKSWEIGDTGRVSKRKNISVDRLAFTCIARHNRAIEYANLIKATYTWAFLVTMLLRLAIVSISGFQVVTRMNKPEETVKFAACGLCFTAYVYLESHYSQILRDHSITIRDYIYNSRWYRVSLKIQKLLLIMTMRCNVPCQLTAGKMVDISVQSFAVFLKTALSYLTVLRSI